MKNIESCDYCGSSNSTTIVVGHDRLYNQSGEFTLQECQQCGLIFLTPRPDADEISRYYPEDYISFPKAIEDERSWFMKIDRSYGIHKRCDQVIRRVGRPGRVLDIGCATGIFLNSMRNRGWDVFGVEPSTYAAQYAIERLKISVHIGILESSTYPSDFFDLVTMWDVLEHVSSPKLVLSEITRILKPGGWLVLSLPNPISFERNWFKHYWAGWDIPRHFHIFSIPVLKNYFSKTGFNFKELTSFTGRHGMLVLNVKFWLADWNGPKIIKDLLINLISSLPVRLLVLPLYRLLELFNRSSNMVVFSQKKVLNYTNRRV